MKTTQLALTLIIVVSVFGQQNAIAQTYSQISPNSDLVCVYPNTGKTKIAVLTNGRYKNLSFKAAIRRTVKMRIQAQKKSRKISQLVKKLRKKQQTAGIQSTLTPKQIKAVKKLILDGDLTANIPLSIGENIMLLEATQQTYIANIGYYSSLISLIKKCKKGQIESPGTLEVRFLNIVKSTYNAKDDASGQGIVGVFAVVPPHIASRKSYLCYDHPRQGIRYEPASTDPCYIETLSSNRESCDALIEKDVNGNPKYYLALLQQLNFFFKERAGAPSFAEQAAATENRLRTGDIYGWTDSVRYAVVSSASECSQSIFD